MGSDPDLMCPFVLAANLKSILILDQEITWWTAHAVSFGGYDSKISKAFLYLAILL